MGLIAILMINLFIFLEITAKMLFHDGPVQIDISLVPVIPFFAMGVRWRRCAIIVPVVAGFNDTILVNFEQFLAHIGLDNIKTLLRGLKCRN